MLKTETPSAIHTELDAYPVPELVTALGLLPLAIESGKAGREIANGLLHRHHLIERMLTEIFGMEWYKVHDEAEQLEHAVSADFERRLIEKLGESADCPHGNRVGMDTPDLRRERGLAPLDEMPPGRAAHVVSVFERDRKLLEYLNELGIRPGTVLEVLSRNYDETFTMRVEGKHVPLGRAAASKIWVQPETAEVDKG